MRIVDGPTFMTDSGYVSLQTVYCTEGETKPVDGIATGSKLVEVDTGKVYFFDESANEGYEWVYQFSFQG